MDMDIQLGDVDDYPSVPESEELMEPEELDSSDWGLTPTLVLIKEEPGTEQRSDSVPPALPRPTLTPRLIIQDIAEAVYQDASGCSNCFVKVRDGGGKRLNEVLCRRRACQEGQTLQVTVIEALDVIFEVTKKSSLSKVLLDEVNYILCWKCTSLLTQLYKLFMKFTESTKVPSFLQSILVQNKPLRVYKQMVKKECESEEDDTITQPLNFEVEMHEGSASYAPPLLSKYVYDEDEDLESEKGEDDDWNDDLDDVDNDSSEDFKIGGSSSKTRRKSKRAQVKQEPGEAPVKRKRGRPPGKKKYPCQECGEVFAKPSKLERHLKVHDIKKHTCTHEGCSAGFKYKFLLDRHVESHSGKSWRATRAASAKKRGRGRPPKIKVTTVGKRDANSGYVCKDCGLVFTKPSRLLRHEAVHVTKSFTCKDCDVGYKSAALLTRHNLRVHGTKPEREPKTGLGEGGDEGEDFSDALPRTRIRRFRDTLRRYDCPECPAKFLRTDHLRRHINVHTEKNHICSICEAGFKAPIHLERHLLTEHADSPDAETIKPRRLRKPAKPSTKSYACTEENCTSIFTRSNHLTRHRKEKHGLDPIREPLEPTPCVVCKLVISTKSKMEKHLSRKHRPNIIVNKFACDECGNKYRDRNNLRNHKLAHRHDKPFMCDICGFATKRSYQLSRHVAMVHVGHRPFLCTTCGMSFKKRQHLRDHESKHFATEYRPFTCTYEGCTKAYRSKRNLSQHLDLHAGHKFICELCGRVFTRRDNLKVHTDTVHLGKPGRVQRDRVIRAATGGPARPRKPRQSRKNIHQGGEQDPLQEEEDDEDDEEMDDTEGNGSLMVAEESLNLSQQHAQPMMASHPHQLHHHLLSNPRLIPQPMIPGQNIVIPNPYGEFFYL